MECCYVALGSNLGDSNALFDRAIAMLKRKEGIREFACSKYYNTTPVNCRSERLFLNAAVRFTTSLSVKAVFAFLEEIECKIGKKKKAKNAPRLIDLDLLFYGKSFYFDQKLMVPHPRWHRRLFVIKPLADLTSTISLSTPINLHKMLSLLSKKSEEQVIANE